MRPPGPDPDPDGDLSEEAVRALADHLTDALDAYLETHLPATDDRAPPDGPTPKDITTGVTLFHASFLVQIGRELFTEAGAAARFYEGQVRSFKDALDVLHEEDDEDGPHGPSSSSSVS
jgi:hypothetical protein